MQAFKFCYLGWNLSHLSSTFHSWKFTILNFISFKDIPTTDGSKSIKTALGTCFPAPVSLKKVLKESSFPPMVLSDGIWPSGWMPCSKQYNSQQALPIWTPACPMCTEIHSRYKSKILELSIKPVLTRCSIVQADLLSVGKVNKVKAFQIFKNIKHEKTFYPVCNYYFFEYSLQIYHPNNNK